MQDVVNVTVFLGDLRDFAVFHRVQKHFFPDNPPALCVTGFDEVGHRGCRIEIELTAMKQDAGLARQAIAWSGPTPFHAPAAMRAGPLLFYSGMLGLNADGELVRSSHELPAEAKKVVQPAEKHEDAQGLAAQCWAALDALKTTAARAGSSLDQIVKTTVYLGHPDDLKTYEAVRSAFFKDDDLPAFECVLIFGPGPVGHARVQVEAIGVAT